MLELSDYPNAGQVRIFDIEAISLPIVYNKYGDHDPNGMMYVLKKDSKRIREKAKKLFKLPVPQPCEEVQPLVIRANVGDTVQINFENKLNRRASIHIAGLPYNVQSSDGANVGYNPDTTTDRSIRYIWQADKEGVYLFSDMADTRSNEEGTNVHGLFGAIIVEAAGSSWLDPVTGKPLESGLFADIYHPARPAFREYSVFFHDELEIKNKDGETPTDPHTGLPNGTTAISYRSEPMRNRLPLDPPEHPGSDDDPGVMGINYRCAPMRERLKIRNDPAHIFSSFVYGDPDTPILETYPGDPIRIRLLDGAHEEQHIFNITGMDWRKEITDPVSPLVQSQTIGISEAFNIQIDNPYAAGDYLYYSGGIDDLWLGLWGIIRAYSEPHKGPLPLCGTRPCAPPHSPPKGAVIRRFEIAAIQKKLVYNSYGDHDPEGLIFVPMEQAQDIMCGKKEAVPLILRANAGDWIEVTLHNLFDPDKPIKYNDYPSVPLDYPHKPSNRVSLSPQFLKYNPVACPGVNVGYNAVEQTVGPGECIKYLWHADKEYGAVLLSSFGDLRNHRHHGLFGAIIIEPTEAKYYSGLRPAAENYRETAVITAPGKETFREFVLFAHNGIRLLDKDGVLIKTTEQDMEDGEGGHGAPDHEDTGEKGYNYRSERFFNRLKRVPIISKVFDSKTHGDPATPVLRSYVGERVIIRLLMPADKPRNISFLLHGHRWRAQPYDPFSRIIPVQGAISVGNVFNIEPEPAKDPGDYLYRSGSLRWDVESGMWGIWRVSGRNIRCRCESVCRNVKLWWEKKWYEK